MGLKEKTLREWYMEIRKYLEIKYCILNNPCIKKEVKGKTQQTKIHGIQVSSV